MGNTLTVANATDGDIYAYASVIELDIKKIDINLKPSAAVDFALDNEEIKLGWLAIGPSRSWTFPRLALNRYFLTVKTQDGNKLICSALQIAWNTNVIVTPDKKLARAKSGKIWIDDCDGTDYTPKKPTQVLRKGASSTTSNGDTVDGPCAVMTSPTATPEEIVARLENSMEIPRFVAALFVTKCFELGEVQVSGIQTFVGDFLKAVGTQLAANSATQDPDISLLVDVLGRHDLFNLTPEDIDYVTNELSAHREETEMLLRKLTTQKENTEQSKDDQ